MNLYIETENGLHKNHPAFEENLIAAFGSIPSNWEPFVRVERPINVGIYQIVNDPVYTKVNDVWTDVWTIRDMTAEEKMAKQQLVKDAWATQDQAENWSAWTFDETTCTMTPPTPYPVLADGTTFFWCGADNNWKEIPVQPVDGGQYEFDYLAWQWVQAVK